MLRVVVFDSGWGGELVANWIEEELGVVDVVRVIDWRHAPYAGRNEVEMLGLVEEALAAYWERTNAVVLAGWAMARIRRELQERHPMTKIVGFGFTKIGMQVSAQRALIFANAGVETELAGWLSGHGTEVVCQDCQGWTELIDNGEMSREELARGLQERSGVDLVLICNTHLWDVEDELREMLRWQVAVYDWRWELLHELSGALKLKGRDGRRLK